MNERLVALRDVDDGSREWKWLKDVSNVWDSSNVHWGDASDDLTRNVGVNGQRHVSEVDEAVVAFSVEEREVDLLASDWSIGGCGVIVRNISENSNLISGCFYDVSVESGEENSKF